MYMNTQLHNSVFQTEIAVETEQSCTEYITGFKSV